MDNRTKDKLHLSKRLIKIEWVSPIMMKLINYSNRNMGNLNSKYLPQGLPTLQLLMEWSWEREIKQWLVGLQALCLSLKLPQCHLLEELLKCLRMKTSNKLLQLLRVLVLPRSDLQKETIAIVADMGLANPQLRMHHLQEVWMKIF